MAALIDGEMLWGQLERSLDSLAGALRACPDELWEARLWEDEPGQWVAPGFGTFWYLGYHALFWLDLYLTGSEEGFAPPPPFDLVEMADGEALPRVYTREELLGYVEICRGRCRATILGMEPEQARRRCAFGWGELSYAELQLRSVRHTEEHAAQLHMLLGQRRPSAQGGRG